MECASESGLFNTVISGFTHLPANNEALFFFMTEYTPVCVCVCSRAHVCMHVHTCVVFSFPILLMAPRLFS